MKRLIAVAAALLFVATPVVAELCGKCSRPAYTTDVGKCEHGRTDLAGPKRSPTRKRGKAAAERARSFKRHMKGFDCHLKYCGETGKPFYNLRLSVPASKSTVVGSRLTVPIDKSQASRIIDHLLASGFFARAKAVDPRSRREGWLAPHGSRYLLTVCNEGMFLREDLGWKLPMLTRLDALRKVLKGDAAVKMDLLLGRLDGLRKAWTEAQEKRPK